MVRDSSHRPLFVGPAPPVLKAIQKEIEQQGLGGEDMKLASVLTALAAEPSTAVGMNSGIFYPEDDMPVAPAGVVMAPSKKARSRPTTGKLKCLVLLVDFIDQKGKRSPKDFEDMLFKKGGHGGKSLRDFYGENSYGQLDVDGKVVGWLTLPKKYSYYVGSDSGGGKYPRNAQKMTEEALKSAVTEGLDLSEFDADGDGYVDGLFVVHSGGGAEEDENTRTRKKKIWSHQWTLHKRFVSNNTTAYSYCTVPEDGKVGVFCHEFGHMLGLPDLYDTTYRSEGVGAWCVMGGGSWNDGGKTPGHFCAWAKERLGWLTPTNVSAATGLTLKPVEHDMKSVFRLWTDGKAGKEYFLIENRQQVGFDIKLPASGLLIWHIDDAEHNNDHPGHYMVGLEQADGKQDLELARNSGDGGDPFPGSSGNTNFNGTTKPDSEDRLGKPTGVAVEQISSNGGGISCKVKV